MQMDKGIDTGDILLQSVVPIDEKETGDSLHDKLTQEGAKLIVKALAQIEAGEITPFKQDDTKSCYAGMLRKSMGEIDWAKDAVCIERMVRGLNSWPSAYTFYHGKTLKIWESSLSVQTNAFPDAAPGTITAVEKEAFCVQTGDGTLKVSVVQLEGKKRMAVKDFLLGNPLKAGETLGEKADK